MDTLTKKIQEAKELSSKLNNLMVEIALLSSMGKECKKPEEFLEKEPVEKIRCEHFEAPKEPTIEDILLSDDADLQDSIAKIKEIAAKCAEKMKPKTDVQKAIDVLTDEVMVKTPEGEVITKEEAAFLEKLSEFQKEDSEALKKVREQIRLKKEKSQAAFENGDRKIKSRASSDSSILYQPIMPDFPEIVDDNSIDFPHPKKETKRKSKKTVRVPLKEANFVSSVKKPLNPKAVEFLKRAGADIPGFLDEIKNQQSEKSLVIEGVDISDINEQDSDLP